ncbi:MAG TPA: hypothetical protein VFR24_27440 [Candidatus Angelobacter sp.]|nr:hypothetical protein [Candidatus Angelobacter sp.]
MKQKNHPNYPTVKTKLKTAFKTLRKQGYFCRMNWWCCQTCGWAAIPENRAEKACFWHDQDHDNLKQEATVCLAWSGNGNEIKKILENVGLSVDWDGAETKRLKVSLPNK